MTSVSKNNTDQSAALSSLLDNARKRLGIVHPLILDFCRHWLEIRQGRPVPHKQHFDPAAIPACLPHTWLYQYNPAQDEFTCRLAGEEVNLAWGKSIKGMTLRNIVGAEDAPTIHARWKHLLERPAILHGNRNERLSRHWHMNAERLILPLADGSADGATHLIGISIYQISDDHTTAPVLRDQDIIVIPCREI